MINDICPQASNGKPRGSIVMNNWHLTIKNSMITHSFWSRESNFSLNFHSANCLLNYIKIWKYSVYNLNFHIFQQNFTSASWLQRICLCSLLPKSSLDPLFHKKSGGPRPLADRHERCPWTPAAILWKPTRYTHRLTLPNKQYLAMAMFYPQ